MDLKEYNTIKTTSTQEGEQVETTCGGCSSLQATIKASSVTGSSLNNHSTESTNYKQDHNASSRLEMTDDNVNIQSVYRTSHFQCPTQSFLAKRCGPYHKPREEIASTNKVPWIDSSVPYNLRPHIYSNEDVASTFSTYEPINTLVKQVSSRTPERFKRIPSKPIYSPPHRVGKPRSPKLATTNRVRVYRSASPEAKKFKALPVNRIVLESRGNLGVPKVEAAKPTIPVSPKFILPSRIARATTPNTNSDKLNANNAAAKNFTGYVTRKGNKFTVPNPFVFATDHTTKKKLNEIEDKVQEQLVLEKEKKFVTRPIPAFHTSLTLKAKKTTEHHPFHFPSEERSRRYQRLFQAKSDAEAKLQLRFKKRKSPVDLSFTPKLIKSVPVKPHTLPITPQLRTKARDEQRKLSMYNNQESSYSNSSFATTINDSSKELVPSSEPLTIPPTATNPSKYALCSDEEEEVEIQTLQPPQTKFKIEVQVKQDMSKASSPNTTAFVDEEKRHSEPFLTSKETLLVDEIDTYDHSY